MTDKQPTKKDCILRNKWLLSARTYYLFPGDDTGMSDHEWDQIAKQLFSKREIFADCKILNDPTYKVGSLFWLKRASYEEELKKYVP
jgi:hypothetical protein